MVEAARAPQAPWRTAAGRLWRRPRGARSAGRAGRARAAGLPRARLQSLAAGGAGLESSRPAARGRRRALVRHGPTGARPVRAQPRGGARVAAAEPAGERAQPAHRCQLGHGRRLCRRTPRWLDDALRGRAVRPAVPVHRHHPHQPVRARQPRGAARRSGRRGLADHRAHRARADPCAQAPRIHRRGARRRPGAARRSCGATCCRTCSARCWCTPRSSCRR